MEFNGDFKNEQLYRVFCLKNKSLCVTALKLDTIG